MIFNLRLRYDNSEEAVCQRQAFLRQKKIGICDIVEACTRERIDASDLGMRDIQLRDIMRQIALHPTLHTLVFTGGNSKNGPEYLFRRQLHDHGLRLSCIKEESPRLHRFSFDNREITTISLISPSNTANRSIGSSDLYKRRRIEDPGYTTFDYRLEQYRGVF